MFLLYSCIVLPPQVWFGLPLSKVPWGDLGRHCPRGWYNWLCCPHIPWSIATRQIQLLSAQRHKDADDIPTWLSASYCWAVGSTFRESENAHIQYQCHQLHTWGTGQWGAQVHSQIRNGIWTRWKAGYRWVLTSTVRI